MQPFNWRSPLRPLALVLFSLFVIFVVSCSSPPVPEETAVPTEEPAAETPPTAESLPAATSEPEVPTAEPTEAVAESGGFGAQADSSSIPGRLVFINSQGQLGTVDPDGRNQRMLATNGIYQFPAWSPTTNQIAAIGSTVAGAGVFVTADEEENVLVSVYEDSSPIYLYWAPDGQNVSFIANHREGLALHVVPADGLSDSAILSTGQPLYWQWLPSEQQQVIAHIGAGTLSYVDVEGNQSETELGDGGIFQAPALSASGDYLAFSQTSGVQKRSIFVQDLQADEQAYEQPHAGILAMSWSPADDKLAYISPAEDRAVFFGPLRLYDAATNESAVVVSSDVLMFFWSPDGRSILYITLRDAEGQQAQADKMRLSKPAAQQDTGFFTAFIYDLETGRSRALLTFRPTFLLVTQFLPFFDQYALSHRVWSPDSRYVVLPTRTEDEQNEIVVVPVNGGSTTAVTEGVAAFWSHQ